MNDIYSIFEDDTGILRVVFVFRCDGSLKHMAFGEIDLAGADDGKSVFRASTTYALM
jgi:hypothetical protein